VRIAHGSSTDGRPPKHGKESADFGVVVPAGSTDPGNPSAGLTHPLDGQARLNRPRRPPPQKPPLVEPLGGRAPFAVGMLPSWGRPWGWDLGLSPPASTSCSYLRHHALLAVTIISTSSATTNGRGANSPGAATTQRSALAHYGITAQLVQDADFGLIEQQIARGIPVPCGYIHRGPVERPTGSGHWLVVIGHTPTHLVVNDPWGSRIL